MRLEPTMGDNTKQVRVDNWGIFFLQRLQMFFSKTDYCDMTLQFEGNVQLKVHRLVMNACTEYFQYLEQTCSLEENVIVMPSDLQADVIVPIVNFMYTGMLEFHLSIFDKLYKTAQVMNITILTKLLEAQKQPLSSMVKILKKKPVEAPHAYSTPVKKSIPKPAHHPDLPAPLPGRKLPVWKRKSIPSPAPSHSHSPAQLSYSEPKWAPPPDPLSVPDNTPKPTRFEWPDDDLPPLNPMDTSFEEISYTSKPLLTQEEEQRASTSFDDLRHLPNANRSSVSSKKTASSSSSPNLDMEELKNYVKEQKIRSGLSQDAADMEDEVVELGKRKMPEQKKGVAKKVRFDESESRQTTISIATDGKSGGDLNHEKIVTEILKKYPQLVKKNKNIRLKIMAKSKGAEAAKVENVQVRAPKLKVTEISKVESPKPSKPRESEPRSDAKAVWTCDRCSTDDEPMEFILYYLYRKHMTDVHNEKFDPKLCKYCGHRCNKQNLLMYHLYTKHGMKPPPGYSFPKCDQCPFIALSANILVRHKSRHGKNEIQCVECKLAFTSQATLTSHIQITGHTGKSSKSNYDCQYCTKRFQSGVNLFSHVRGQHKNEALRDGIVSIDEMDYMEELDDDEAVKDEYILPEIIADPETQVSKKVNILSNVKVQNQQEHTRHQQLTLEPSSEAEALNNVATGIATSLGLVDIVVLNDSQQIFLQPNQQTFSDQNEQPEFILPELSGRDSFTTAQNEVITTDGVITQSMLSSGDIGSTDELVMVLTDHDYGDNQEEVNNDNSNIVVLYSHPVDGQQEQFITSQDNIMVNSQGMIEIRNGATITSTANQVVMNPQETHIESIEMIQREIENHQELKQESLYDNENKPAVSKDENPKETEVVPPRTDAIIESLTQGEQIEFTSPLVPPEEDLNQQSEETPVENEDPREETENDGKPKEQQITTEEETNKGETELEVPEENAAEAKLSELEETKDEEETLPISEEHCHVDQMPEEGVVEENEEAASVEAAASVAPAEDVTSEDPVGDVTSEDPVGNVSTGASFEDPASEAAVEYSTSGAPVDDATSGTPVEGHDGVPTEGAMSVIPEESEPEKLHVEENVPPVNEEAPEDMEVTEERTEETAPRVEEREKETPSEDKTDSMEIDEELGDEAVEDEKMREETSGEQELSQSDTSTSQYNDENSQSSQDSHQKRISTKISILDDWEDTDSQQSDQKEKAKVAGETVHKLMDDWEEEDDEDDSRREMEG